MQWFDFTKVQGYGHLFPCKPVVFPALSAIAVFNIGILKATWEHASLSEYPMHNIPATWVKSPPIHALALSTLPCSE